MAGDVLTYLLDKIKERRESYADHLLEGSIKGIEDYRTVTGTIRGLDMVTADIIDIMSRMNAGEDDDID